LRRIVFLHPCVRREAKLPPRSDCSDAVAPFEKMARRQLLDSLDERPRRRDIVEGKKVLESRHIEPASDFGVREQDFQFGSEDDVTADAPQIERFDADPVSGKHETLPGLGPDCHREHSAEALETLRVPFDKGTQSDFSITVRAEAMSQSF